MKNLFKVIAVVAVFGFASCTPEDEIVTNENTIIQTDQFGTNKDDITNPNNDGGEDPDNGEE
ncbi:conserved hypothetical protein [Tenacibaculum sp. 190524A05c]